MGLRCLLGHDFGDVEVEREREEDGNEMVVTIREVKTCNRCGKERVVSENKEVTSIKTPEEAGIEEGAETEASAEEPTHPAVEEEPETFEAPENAEEDDAVILDEEEPEPQRSPGEWPDAERPQSSTTPMQDEAGGPEAEAPAAESEPSAESTADLTEDVAAVEEEGAEPAPVEGEEADVEILGADSDSAGVAEPESSAADSSAAEPEPESTTGGSATEWPEHTGEDEGFDAEAGGGDGVSFGGNSLTPEVESETIEDEDVEFIDAADTPEHTEYSGSAEPGAEHTEYSGSAEPGAEPAEYAESEGNSAVEDAGGDHVSGPTTSDTSTNIAREESASIDLGPADADTEYYCPNCNMTRNAGGSSMRAGDICPECRKGYITERDI